MFEQRAICVAADCTGDGLLGYIRLNALDVFEGTSDAFLVARRILIPIRQLETGAKTMTAGDYTARIAQNRQDELGRLIARYNTLADTLERTDMAERAWISNTCHELQTPLASLRAQIEAVQDGVRQPDPQTLAGMHVSVIRLSRLVQDIKTLSYSREAGLMTAFHAEGFSAIIRQAAASAQPQFATKLIGIDLDLPETMPLGCGSVRSSITCCNMRCAVQMKAGMCG